MFPRSLALMPLIVILLVAARAVPAAPASDLYTIDPAHTSVVFSCAHLGLSYTYGFFREVSGKYLIDETRPENCRFQLAIQAASLDTNNADRDKHLRSADFFNVQQFPLITFDSTRCEAAKTPEGGILYQVTGDLTIHGVKRPVTLNLRMQGKGPGAYGDPRTGFLCQMELKRTEFGMDKLLEKNMVGDAVGVTVSFEGSLQPEQPGAATRTDNQRP